MKSRLHLPKLAAPPKTILEYLIARFPRIEPETWHERMAGHRIVLDDGTILDADSPYRHGVTVLYSKEVPEEMHEPSVDVEETILYWDANIIVADKPHGMVVTPAGNQVERSLLVRLQNHTGLTALAPVHRLDRETAGIVLFAIHADARAQYHRLFSERIVEREYLAIAKLNNLDQYEWHVKNRLEQSEPWYRRRIAESSTGEANAITRITLLESRSGLGLFRLRPETGKKHQLRVHMASIGSPITGDLLYPEIRMKQDGDPPLQLLAYRLWFIDPLSGEPRSFKSAQKLLWPVE